MKVSFPFMFQGMVCSGLCRNTGGKRHLVVFCMTCIGARPGWFEDSFSLKLGLPGSAGSVPTVLHDATDTGTDYIVKHLIVVGPRVPK